MSDGSDERESATTESPPAEAPTTESTGKAGEDDLESIEVVVTGVEDDGTVIVDDLVAEVDSKGHVVATDELVEIDLPDGTIITDETFSVADESGELVAIDEETTVITPDEGEPPAPVSATAESNGSRSS